MEVSDQHPLGLVPNIRSRMLIPAVRRIPLGMMGQPVLVAINAYQVLQAHRDASLLVGLELGQVEDDITSDRRAGNEIFMTPTTVVVVYLPSIVISPVVASSAAVIRKFAILSQVEGNITIGITGQPPPADDDAISVDPFLLAQIYQLEIQPLGTVEVTDHI